MPLHKGMASTASYSLSAAWAQGEGKKNTEYIFNRPGDNRQTDLLCA